MRDFRDAKATARALRDALKAKTIEITHSQCLELIAKAFGYENWNILAAKIEAARSGALDAVVVSTDGTITAETNSALSLLVLRQVSARSAEAHCWANGLYLRWVYRTVRWHHRR